MNNGAFYGKLTVGPGMDLPKEFFEPLTACSGKQIIRIIAMFFRTL